MIKKILDIKTKFYTKIKLFFNQNLNLNGFSLAETMVVMLMLSIIFAAATPILTKRVTQTNEIKMKNSGIPIGTVILWMIETLPQGDEAGKWLECNGSNFSETNYPELKLLLGTTTLPDFTNRFPQGNSSPQNYISAGLPNITGSVGGFKAARNNQMSGAFTLRGNTGSSDDSGPLYPSSANFDASKSNAIYGNSTTVQPPAITVKYLIKAKS